MSNENDRLNVTMITTVYKNLMGKKKKIKNMLTCCTYSVYLVWYGPLIAISI